MVDLWIAVGLTGLVTIITIGADWIASKLVVAARTIRSLQRIVESGRSPADAYPEILRELERHQSIQAGTMSWGTDLATVAIALDFTALVVWIHNPSMFPFFSNLNQGTTTRDVPLWFIVIGVHAVLLVASLILKHNHGDVVGRSTPADLLSKAWIMRNRWMLGANLVGFISLLSSIVVLTDAIMIYA